MAGSQDFAADPRNEAVQIYLNGQFVPREKALVSIFDAGWILGDGIWEGLRMHGGRLAFMQRHLDRLFMGARAIDLERSNACTPESRRADLRARARYKVWRTGSTNVCLWWWWGGGGGGLCVGEA